ncbi:MAG: DNA replication and repair protein RecF [Prolixibacteraceae bacterium]|nr:DNA replication and repair protein RecF [Prolixibacteraceae bacterium]
MHLQKLTLLDYKNIEQAELDFCPKLNCFLGDNGAGKTNLMDTIYYLSFSKSFFNPVDTQNIRHGREMFMIQGKYARLDTDEVIAVGFKTGSPKTFKRNQKPYRKLSEHIGLFPLVMISPSDSILITGGSEERRKFMDGVIAQFDRQYLDALLRYNRTLQQRNNLLKYFQETRSFNADNLAVYDEQLVFYGTSIHEKRKQFIAQMIPYFQKFYDFIAMGKEQVVLNYESSLDQGNFQDQLTAARNRDRAVLFTTTGIHKDDLHLGLGDFPIRKLGSQGQTKTYLLALKFAQFEYLKNAGEIKPILLLDDLFDKLDANRVGKIIELVANDQFGQIFITDTNREHLAGILEKMKTEYRIFQINQGKVI